MTHPPSGPGTPPPPSGPRRPEPETPLDPNSARGRAVAHRLTRTLAAIEVEIAERRYAARADAA